MHSNKKIRRKYALEKFITSSSDSHASERGDVP